MTVEELGEGTLFREVAERTRRAWADAHPGREAELRQVEAAIVNRRQALDRYLRAFEVGELPASACGHRIREIEQEIRVLETGKATLEAEMAQAPGIPSDDLLGELEAKIRSAADNGDAEQLKRLLQAVVAVIDVESRACIKPFFDLPRVKHTNPSCALRHRLWVGAGEWGRA